MRGQNENAATGLVRKTRGNYINPVQQKKLKIQKHTENYCQLIENKTTKLKPEHPYPNLKWQKSYDFLETLEKENQQTIRQIINEIMQQKTMTLKEAGSALATLHYMRGLTAEDKTFERTYESITSAFDQEEKNVLASLIFYDNDTEISDMDEKTVKNHIMNECFYESIMQGKNAASRSFFMVWNDYHKPKLYEGKYAKDIMAFAPEELAQNYKNIRLNHRQLFIRAFPDFAVADTIDNYLDFDMEFSNQWNSDKKDAAEQFINMREKVYDRLVSDLNVEEHELEEVKRYNHIETLQICSTYGISFKEGYLSFLKEKIHNIRRENRHN